MKAILLVSAGIYDWGIGDYQMKLAPDGKDADGVWYGVWITDLDTGKTTWAGSLKFSLADGKSAVRPMAYSTLEIYGGDSIRPIDIPEWHVSIKRPLIDDAEASGAYLGYSLRGAVVANADVQYDDKAEILHFRIGGDTEQVGGHRQDRILRDCLLNLSATPFEKN